MILIAQDFTFCSLLGGANLERFGNRNQNVQGMQMPKFSRIADLAARAPQSALADMLGAAVLATLIVAGFGLG